MFRDSMWVIAATTHNHARTYTATSTRELRGAVSSDGSMTCMSIYQICHIVPPANAQHSAVLPILPSNQAFLALHAF